MGCYGNGPRMLTCLRCAQEFKIHTNTYTTLKTVITLKTTITRQKIIHLLSVHSMSLCINTFLYAEFVIIDIRLLTRVTHPRGWMWAGLNSPVEPCSIELEASSAQCIRLRHTTDEPVANDPALLIAVRQHHSTPVPHTSSHSFGR